MSADAFREQRGAVGLSVQMPSEDRRVGWTVSSGDCRVQREAVGMGAQWLSQDKETSCDGGQKGGVCMCVQFAPCGSERGVGLCVKAAAGCTEHLGGGRGVVWEGEDRGGCRP